MNTEQDSHEPDPDTDQAGRPGADWVQEDIKRAVDFRKEYYKYTAGIATALLAFTISFPASLTAVESPELIKVAWIGLGVATLCSVVVHYLWAWFYISYRDFDNAGHKDQGKARRKWITGCRRILEAVLLISLICGVLGVAGFASINLHNMALQKVVRSESHGN